MRLQLDITHIKDVRFGAETTINDGMLQINRQELQHILGEDKRLSHVEVDLAHPGEKSRIIQVTDVVEPRAKKNGGVDFPGALGKHGSAGQGTTCVLRGTAVVVNEYFEPGDSPSEPSGPQVGEVIDMWGPGAELGIYGKTHNIILISRPAAGVSLNDYRIGLKIVGLKTAVYLANAAKNMEADEIEVYDLPPLSRISKEIEALPKVAYVFQFISGQFVSIPGHPILYGSGAERIAPTILHPNEILDGAIVTPYRSMGMEVFGLQNHSIIKELYRRHGKDLCFVGVVIVVAHDKEQENERAATMAAHLVKWILGADGVILTKSGGGIPEVTMALTAQRCEELGVRTSLALFHYPTVLSGGDSTTLFNAPEVDAIVSLGTPHALITLPPVEKVIGKPADSWEEALARGEIRTTLRTVKGAVSQIGNSRFVAVRY
jgi:sarcosine reductase